MLHTDLGELRIVRQGKRPAEITPTRSGNVLSWKAGFGPPLWSGPPLYYNVWASSANGACLRFIGRTQIRRYDLAQPLFAPAPSGSGYEVQPVNVAGRAGELSGPPCRPGG